VLALCGEANQAKLLTDELIKLYPEDTVMTSILAPTIRAAVELHRGNAAQAIEQLQSVIRYEAAAEFWPQYLRALSYLKLRRGPEAKGRVSKDSRQPGAGRFVAFVPSRVSRPRALVGRDRRYSEKRESPGRFFRLLEGRRSRPPDSDRSEKAISKLPRAARRKNPSQLED